MTYTYRKLEGKDRMITSKMRINIVKYRAYLLLFVAGLGDLGTSLYNSSIGCTGNATLCVSVPCYLNLLRFRLVFSSAFLQFSSDLDA